VARETAGCLLFCHEGALVAFFVVYGEIAEISSRVGFRKCTSTSSTREAQTHGRSSSAYVSWMELSLLLVGLSLGLK
jgi:hypothetical protein